MTQEKEGAKFAFDVGEESLGCSSVSDQSTLLPIVVARPSLFGRSDDDRFLLCEIKKGQDPTGGDTRQGDDVERRRGGERSINLSVEGDQQL